MKKALFVCYGGGHADALIPIMKELITRNNIKVEAIGVNLAADKIRNAGIPCKSLSNYLDVESVEVGYPLAKARHNFSSTVSFADSIAYYGYTMSDLVEEVGEKTANKILEIFDRRTMFPARTMVRILKIEKPDVVITTTMNRFEAATLYAAGILGIPSVKVEDLIGKINKTFPDKIQVDTIEEKEKMIGQGVAEKKIIVKSEMEDSAVMDYYETIHKRQLDLRPTAFAVLCEYAKQIITSRGIDEKTIHVTGQPAFDQHPWFLKNTNKADVCDKLGIDSEKRVIVFMSQPNREREEVLKTLITAVKGLKCDDVQFVIKLHPNEDGKIQKIILDDFGVNNIAIVKDIDARAITAISDLVITVSSTTGLEAAVMGKPLVYINVTDREDSIPFDKMGIGIRCTNSDNLTDVLQGFVDGKLPFVLEGTAVYATDGKASARIASLIENFATKNYKTHKNILVAIQARMGSTRLPGKVLMPIEDKKQIQHVVDRMNKCSLVNQVAVVTSDNPENDVLKEYLDSNGISWFSGSETDVLSRYIGAAHKYGADVIVRVTGDNPLTDPEVVDRIIESHLQMNADYSTMKGLPIGVTASVINVSSLERIFNEADITDRDKEHVTIYAYEHPEKYKINYMQAPEEVRYPELRFTVDTKEDYEHMKEIYKACYRDGYVKLQDAIMFVTNQSEV